MLSKGLFSLVIVGFGFFILSVMIPSISSKVNNLRTDQVTETLLQCSTLPTTTECTVQLANKSAYEPISPRIVVTETSPGSVIRTSTSILDSNLQDVTISGLANNLTYQFTIQYYKVDTVVQNSTSLNSILKRFNLLIVLGALAVLVVGVGLSFNYGKFA